MLAGCDTLDVTEATYSNMADAMSRGGVSNGWIPAWLPASAAQLREIHNVDTNESALSFNFEQRDWRPPPGCKTIAAPEVMPSRYRQDWWPTENALSHSYAFFRCPSDVSPTSMFVGIHSSGGSAVHWRVSAR